MKFSRVRKKFVVAKCDHKGLKPDFLRELYGALKAVQFHDILYKTFRDILYTPAHRRRGWRVRKQLAPEGKGWLGERGSWKLAFVIRGRDAPATAGGTPALLLLLFVVVEGFPEADPDVE